MFIDHVLPSICQVLVICRECDPDSCGLEYRVLSELYCPVLYQTGTDGGPHQGSPTLKCGLVGGVGGEGHCSLVLTVTPERNDFPFLSTSANSTFPPPIKVQFKSSFLQETVPAYINSSLQTPKHSSNSIVWQSMPCIPA